MKRSNSNLVLWLITIGLLAYTGFRSFHLVSQSLPGDAKIAGIAALFALDIGLLAWTSFAGHARGDQVTVCYLMIVVDIIGIGAAVLADTLLMSPGGAAYADVISVVASWVIPVIVISNVAATVYAKLRDPGQLLKEAERDADEAMQRALADAIRSNAAQVAQDVAKDVYAQKRAELSASFKSSYHQFSDHQSGEGYDVRRVVEDVVRKLQAGTDPASLPEAQVSAKPGRNGKKGDDTSPKA